jgi:hypothetical protein
MPDRLVYSTDAGRVTTCSVCGQPYEQCRCDQPAPPLVQKNDGIVRVMRDRKHRGGKTVTVVTACSMRSSLNGPVAQATTKRLSRSWTRHPQRSPLSGWQAAPFFSVQTTRTHRFRPGSGADRVSLPKFCRHQVITFTCWGMNV